MSEIQSENAAVIEAIERIGACDEVRLETGGDVELIVLPKGKTVVDLKPFIDARRTAPERRTGIAQFTALESFIGHANRFKDPHSAIFAVDNPRAPQLIAVLNYHEGGGIDIGSARFGDHRGVYAFPLSDEWKAWTSLPEKIDQATFAAFLEDHAHDVLAPSGIGEKTAEIAQDAGITLASQARLMELSRGLSVRVESKVAQHINPNTGEAQLSYEETHTSKDFGPLKVPDGFVIAIPVFRNGPLYQIVCRLRYRVVRSEGKVVWGVALHRADRAFRDAFTEAAERAAGQTELPLFYGTPE